MGSATSRLCGVLTVSAIFSGSVFVLAGVAGLPPRDPGIRSIRVAAAPACDDRIFPYVAGECRVAAPPARIAVAEGKTSGRQARTEAATMMISAAADVTATLVAPSLPPPAVVREAIVATSVASADLPPARDRAAEPIRPEPKAMARAEPPRPLRAPKAYEPISGPRIVDAAAAVERPEGARPIRVIPIDRPHLAAAPAEPDRGGAPPAGPISGPPALAPDLETASAPVRNPAPDGHSVSVDAAPDRQDPVVVSAIELPRQGAPLTIVLPDEQRQEASRTERRRVERGDAAERVAQVPRDPRLLRAEAREGRAEERRARREEARAAREAARATREAASAQRRFARTKDERDGYRSRRYERRYSGRYGRRGEWAYADVPGERYQDRRGVEPSNRVYYTRRSAPSDGIFGWLTGSN